MARLRIAAGMLLAAAATLSSAQTGGAQPVLVPMPMPIQAGGELVGAIGVSGAPSGQTDERCARKGLEAISEDLELGG